MAIQVYMATHDGEGNPLSVLQKHFISFSYGGKNIEDFNLNNHNKKREDFNPLFYNL